MECRSCGEPLRHRVLDLGEQPAADAFPPAQDPSPDPCWPLELWVCSTCGLAQLGAPAPLPPEPVRAVESATAQAHAEASVAQLLAEGRQRAGSTVREAASHHGGSWLPHLLAAGLTAAPAGQPADLVVDVHALAHEEDLGSTLAARAAALAPGGRLVLEFHHLLPLLEQGQFDTVRHGHPVYLSLSALQPALARRGLHPVSARRSPVYGGSLQVTAVADAQVRPDASVREVLEHERAAGVTDPARLGELDARAARTSAALHDHLVRARRDGRTVLGYGAPSRAAVLLRRSGVDADLLAFTVDLSVAKHGRRVPGCRIPIRAPEELLAARPDEVLVLTWDLAAEVAAQLSAVHDWGGRFLVPLPELREYR